MVELCLHCRCPEEQHYHHNLSKRKRATSTDSLRMPARHQSLHGMTAGAVV
jgi:hypothetical protein